MDQHQHQAAEGKEGEQYLDPTLMERIKIAAAQLKAASNVAVFSGSGISAESGIPTFRGEGGLWEEFSPTWYANLPGLLTIGVFRPGRMKQFFRAVLDTFLQAQPNPAHLALARLEETKHVEIVTQNVDNLHQSGGSSIVWEVHGSLLGTRCEKCWKKKKISPEELEEMAEVFLNSGWLLPRLISLRGMPECEECGGLKRPDVVLFGESLPSDQWAGSTRAMANADVLIVIGTSGTVYPAASLPDIAIRRGVKVIEINPEPIFRSGVDHITLEGTASVVLPELIDYMYMGK